MRLDRDDPAVRHRDDLVCRIVGAAELAADIDALMARIAGAGQVGLHAACALFAEIVLPGVAVIARVALFDTAGIVLRAELDAGGPEPVGIVAALVAVDL